MGVREGFLEEETLGRGQEGRRDQDISIRDQRLQKLKTACSAGRRRDGGRMRGSARGVGVGRGALNTRPKQGFYQGMVGTEVLWEVVCNLIPRRALGAGWLATAELGPRAGSLLAVPLPSALGCPCLGSPLPGKPPEPWLGLSESSATAEAPQQG